MKTTICLFLAFLCQSAANLKVQAVIPPPDGGYPGGNTAEGQNALLSLSSGGYNTAVDFVSLRTNTTSSFNTAIGAGALFSNIADENTATGAGALLSNTNGDRNTANGAFVLFNNITGPSKTGVTARERSFRIQPAPAIQPVVARRCFPTQPDSKTRLQAVLRYKTTQPATTTWPPVLLR